MLDPTVFAIPLFAILIFVELFLTVRLKSENYTKLDAFSSISMGLGSMLVGIVTKVVVFAVYSFVYQYRLFSFEMSLPIIVLLFFLDDFCYYWFHRLSHSIRFLWASHSIHHSSEKYLFVLDYFTLYWLFSRMGNDDESPKFNLPILDSYRNDYKITSLV